MPFHFVLERLARVAAYGLWNATRWRVPRQAGAGVVEALREVAHHPHDRRPLTRPLPRAFCAMRDGHAPMAAIEPLLPPPLSP